MGDIAIADDPNIFIPISVKLPPVEEGETKDFLFSFLTDQQREILTMEKQVSFSASIGKSLFRITGYFQRGYVSVALRRLKEKIPTLKELHFPDEAVDVIDFRKLNYGFFIVSGPTGAGKTTSAVSLLSDKLSLKKGLHVVSVESPIEYKFPVSINQSVIEQREVGTDTPSFSQAMKDIVRESPNIIFVGEVRDADTARNCLWLATTGHMVITTFHAASIEETAGRFMSFLSDRDRGMFANALHGIINQSLYKVGNNTFPIVESVKNDESIRTIVLKERWEQLREYFNSSNSFTKKNSLQWIQRHQSDEEIDDIPLLRRRRIQ